MIKTMIQKHAIGTQYLTRGKHPRLCTITDFMTVTNSKGEIVKTYYESQHEFMGQIVIDRNVPHASVDMGVAKLEAA
jgi:hypothetical protein